MQKNSYSGRFIVFDGLDGSGQSTQAKILVEYLNAQSTKHLLGHTGAYYTKEPTSSLIGGLIRGQLTHEWKSSAECLQLLFAADRAHHLEKDIIPLLERGVIVVCDRYLFSTIAFGFREIKDKGWLKEINKNFLLPDLTFFLRVSPKICMERIRRARFGITLYEKEDILQEVWLQYEKLAQEYQNVHIVDGERSVDSIAKEIQEIVIQKLKR